MNTEQTIYIKDTDINIENIKIVKLKEDEKNCIKSYVEITTYKKYINYYTYINVI